MKRLPYQIALLSLVFSAFAGATENYTAPEPVEPIEPAPYPAGALEDSFEGECLVGLLINSGGVVSETWIVKTSGREDIDLASLETADATRWNPAALNGVPVSSPITIPFNFKLGILPGDPLAPVTAEPVETLETSEPVLELNPLEPIRIGHLPTTEGGFSIVGLETDELGLVLKAWIIRPSGHNTADEKLLDAVYTTRWEAEIPIDGFIRGFYFHLFRESLATTGDEEEEPMEEETIGQSGGACAFDQLKIGKYGQR